MKPSSDLRLLYWPRITCRVGSAMAAFLIGVVFWSSCVATDFATTGHVKTGSGTLVDSPIAARSLPTIFEAEMSQAETAPSEEEEEEDC